MISNISVCGWSYRVGRGAERLVREMDKIGVEYLWRRI